VNRLLLAAFTAILVSASLGSRESRADPPTCFPERTVLWAATFFDEHGNAFGGIRAGHLVRIREDFVGPNGDQALIEVDEPVRVQAMVPRRVLVAFTRQELEPMVGFSRWVAGAPVTVGRLEDGFPRLFLADPHDQPKESPSMTSQCSAISGSIAIRYRDGCHGAWPTTNATTHGERKVFWKAPTRLKSLHGADVVTIPAEEWVFLVDRGKEHSVIEYRNWLRHTLYLGQAPTRGMQYVPSGIDRGSNHLCCEGFLAFRPEVKVSEGREAVILSSAPISTPDSKSVATLNKGLRVRVLREQDYMAFVAYRWPTWDVKNFTFQLHGWIDKKFLGEVENGRPPRDAGPGDAVEQGVAPLVRSGSKKNRD
jgi:hypothetical protein